MWKNLCLQHVCQQNFHNQTHRELFFYNLLFFIRQLENQKKTYSNDYTQLYVETNSAFVHTAFALLHPFAHCKPMLDLVIHETSTRHYLFSRPHLTYWTIAVCKDLYQRSETVKVLFPLRFGLI